MDEARADDGSAREPYAAVLDALEGADLPDVGRRVAAATAELGVTHGAGEACHPFVIDPVPRVFAAEEWRALEAGLAQRVRALEAFVADVHGEQAALAAGVVPREAVESCVWFEPDVRELPPPPLWIGVAGPDVVRDGRGRLVVLEDNVRTPTMMAYAVVARRVVDATLDTAAPSAVAVEEPLVAALWRTLAAAAPDGIDDASVAILTEGAANALRWEIEALGRLLDVPVVEPADLEVRRGRLCVRATGARVDVVFRRTSEERLRDGHGRLNVLGELLLDPLRAGTLRVVNAFGTGVADDKRIYPHVEDLVRFFCCEEPLVRSVATYDLADAARRAEAMSRLEELVVKPRGGSGGFGVVVGPRASPRELDATRDAIRVDPARFVAQEAVEISTHPTLVDGRLEPRHLDLRPFAFCDGERVRVLPGGLSRFALAAGDLVVNCSQGGGGKDVRVMPRGD